MFLPKSESMNRKVSLNEEVFLSVAYLLISLSGTCQIELLELCMISLGLGDTFFLLSSNRSIEDTITQPRIWLN